MVLFKLLPAFLSEVIFLEGVHSNLSGGLDESNLISLEAIQRFTSSVETKEESFF